MTKRLWLTALLAFILTGCGDEASTPEVLTSESGAKLLVSSYSGEGMEASLQGKLEVGAGNCLYLTGGTVPSLIFWPKGSQFSSDGTAVERPGSGVVVIGTEIKVSGGGVDLSSDADRYPEIPSGCNAEDLVRVN